MILSDRRKAAGYSKDDASKALHIDISALDEIEAGRMEPTLGQVRSMAKLYRCETRDLETCLDRRTLYGWRVSEGMTQRELGQLLGRTRPTVTQWENGLSAPTKSNLEQLAELMGLSPQELAESEGWRCDGEEDGKCRK